MDDYTLLHGDCLTEMAAMDAGSVDAVVTDPPYHLTQASRNGSPRQNDPATPFGRTRLGSAGFMGKTWDGGDIATTPEVWAEALRVLKPSHYLLAFGGTRTWHRLACAIEDAGFEIRDTLMWLYGSGFPKGKSCLKPAWEPIILARKPGPMRELGIDSCRIGMMTQAEVDRSGLSTKPSVTATGLEPMTWQGKAPSGRWPANLILECTCDETREGAAKSPKPYVPSVVRSGMFGIGGVGHDREYGDENGKEPVRIHTDPNCPCAMLDGQTGTKTSGYMAPDTERSSRSMYGQGNGTPTETGTYGDSGGASRFFYCSKASRSERNKGLGGSDGVPDSHNLSSNACARCGLQVQSNGSGKKCECGDERVTVKLPRQPNHHPTVKPVALMRWLVKLVAQPGDVVLDPFAGSGTTGVACVMEGREFIGIEREAEYIEIARRRIEAASAQGRLPLDESPPLPPVAGRPT